MKRPRWRARSSEISRCVCPIVASSSWCTVGLAETRAGWPALPRRPGAAGEKRRNAPFASASRPDHLPLRISAASSSIRRARARARAEAVPLLGGPPPPAFASRPREALGLAVRRAPSLGCRRRRAAGRGAARGRHLRGCSVVSSVSTLGALTWSASASVMLALTAERKARGGAADAESASSFRAVGGLLEEGEAVVCGFAAEQQRARVVEGARHRVTALAAADRLAAQRELAARRLRRRLRAQPSAGRRPMRGVARSSVPFVDRLVAREARVGRLRLRRERLLACQMRPDAFGRSHNSRNEPLPRGGSVTTGGVVSGSPASDRRRSRRGTRPSSPAPVVAVRRRRSCRPVPARPSALQLVAGARPSAPVEIATMPACASIWLSAPTLSDHIEGVVLEVSNMVSRVCSRSHRPACRRAGADEGPRVGGQIGHPRLVEARCCRRYLLYSRCASSLGMRMRRPPARCDGGAPR